MIYDYCMKKHMELVPLYHEFKDVSESIRPVEAREEKEKLKKQLERISKAICKIDPHVAFLESDALRLKKQKNEVHQAWKADESIRNLDNFREESVDFNVMPDGFDFAPNVSILAELPRYSALLTVAFELTKPYISKDDKDFYILDNPLRREKVFQIPMVSPSGWKGALRSAMIKEFIEWWFDLDEEHRENEREEFIKKRVQLARIFGDEKDMPPYDKGVEDQQSKQAFLDTAGDEQLSIEYRERIYANFESEIFFNGLFSGRLRFYPTFFKTDSKIGFEVINPHDREAGKGINPILYECLKEGKGELALLYVPFGSRVRNDDELKNEVRHDLDEIREGVNAMMNKYGFGAKTSSGYGQAKILGEVQWKMRGGSGKIVDVLVDKIKKDGKE